MLITSLILCQTLLGSLIQQQTHVNSITCKTQFCYKRLGAMQLYISEVTTVELVRWVHTCNVTAYRNVSSDTIRNYDLNVQPVPPGVTVSCERYTVGFPVCYGSQKHHECKAGERSGRWWRVTLHAHTCPGLNRIIPLMRRPNTNSAPKMPATLPRNQLLIRYVVTSPVHTVTIGCYGTR
jgi:hypothetical protein